MSSGNMLKKKKWMAWVVMLVFLFVSIMPTAALAKPGNGNGNGNNKGDSSITATVPTTDIAVQKIWNDEGNKAGKRPEKIKVHLMANSADTDNELTLKATDGWVGAFENVPVCDDKGNTIQYTVEEDTVENYTVSYHQPVVGGIDTIQLPNKVPNCNQNDYGIPGANIIVAKTHSLTGKDSSYFIWTKNPLSEDLRKILTTRLNAGNPKLEGAGQNFVYTGSADSANNTVFVDGFPCTINVEKQGLYKIEINTKDGKQNIHFDESKLWEMFWYGSIELVGAQKAVITNTYNPVEPTPETGSIKIQKSTVLKGEGNQETALPVTQSYQFTITPQDGEDITLPATLEINNGVADAAVTVENNVATVTVPLNNETAKTVEISGLPTGSYVVDETKESQTPLSAEYKFDNVIRSNESVTVSKEPVADVAFKNVYQKVESGGNTEAKTGEFSFVKVDEADTTKTLADAEFTLYSDENCNYPETDVNVVASDGDGVVKFTGLKLGDNGEATYYLKETKAPAGYELSNVIYKVAFTGETDFAISNDSSGNSVAKADKNGYKITNTAIEIPPVTVAGAYSIAKNVVAEENVLEELKKKDFLFHVELAVVTTGSAYNYDSFEDAKRDAVDSAMDPDNPAWVQSLTVKVGEKPVDVVSLMDNNYQFDLTVTGETTLGFNVDAQLATGSALIWARFTEDAAVATESDLQWEASTGKDSATVIFDGANSWFGQLTSGSIYQFVNTYTNTATTPEEVIPEKPVVPPVEGGGDTGNENTGGNTGNENTGGNTGNENTGGNEGSNNDTDNTTTIVDEPTPLVNVPEEPIEELLEEPIEEIEIDEPEVPLTEAPGEPVAIEEPEVPLGDAPKTGDSSNAVLFVALMLAAYRALSLYDL